MTDLVKRLRDKVEASRIYDDDEELLDEAADCIEKLEDTIEVMQHQLKELQWSFDCKDDLHKQDYERMKKYLDRIEKLEAALREIAAPDWDGESYPDEIARKALEGKDD
jgi:hypothetical protein